MQFLSFGLYYTWWDLYTKFVFIIYIHLWRNIWT